MSKQSPHKQYNIAEMMPDEVNALRALVQEFMGKVQNVDNEIETLKEDRKTLIEDYSDKLDMKTLMAALKVLKIQHGVQHRDTFDLFVEVLTDPSK
jgi:uncharacterized protein (UPF0335 family)